MRHGKLHWLGLLLGGLLLGGMSLPAGGQMAAGERGRDSAGETPALPSSALPSSALPSSAPMHSGAIWVSAIGTQYREPLRIEKFINELRALPFGEIIIQVRVDGEALYKSEILPRAVGVPETFDPLDALLKGLRAPEKVGQLGGNGKPKKVIAWFPPYGMGNKETVTGLTEKHAQKQHPEWLSRRADGAATDADGNQFLEPGLTDVQIHLHQVIDELVRRYDVDGIYFDPVADPAGDGRWGYHPEVLKLWQQQSGRGGAPESSDPQWIAFRAGLLTQAAQGLAEAARRARPGLRIGFGGEALGPAPTTGPQFELTSVYTLSRQDWPRWLAMGFMDAFYLKDFRAEQSAADDFDGWLRFARTAAAPRSVPLIAGVAGRQNGALETLSQLRRALDLGADGLALADHQTPVLDAGAQSMFYNTVARTVLSPVSSGGRVRRITTAEPVGLGSERVVATGETTPSEAPQPVPAETVAAAGTMALAATPVPNEAPLSRDPGSLVPLDAPDEPLPPPPGETPPGTLIPVLKPGPAGEEALPPPPTLSEVMEEGTGALLPAGVAPAERSGARGGEAGDPTLNMLGGLAGMDLSKQFERVPESMALRTRREMLAELLADPRFATERSAQIIRPEAHSLEQLRTRFPNIF